VVIRFLCLPRSRLRPGVFFVILHSEESSAGY
jgi:hypothetical protein